MHCQGCSGIRRECHEVVKRTEVRSLVLGAHVVEHPVDAVLDAIELLVDLRQSHCGGDRDGVEGQSGPCGLKLCPCRGTVGKDCGAGEEPVLCLPERCPGGKHCLVQLLARLGERCEPHSERGRLPQRQPDCVLAEKFDVLRRYGSQVKLGKAFWQAPACARRGYWC